MEVKIPTMSKEYREKEQKKTRKEDKRVVELEKQVIELEAYIKKLEENSNNWNDKIEELRIRAESYKSKLIVYKDIVELLLSKLVDRE